MKPTVLITGATKGIGRACAERFAREGYQVTAVARTAADLRELAAATGAESIQADLSDANQLLKIPETAYDVVVLNAAAFAPGKLLSEADIFTDLWSLNVHANYELARRLLPPMIARGRGHLVVIGSTGTDHWKQHMTAYVATKFALRGLFLGWQAELADTPVKCTLVAPGATLTASWADETPPADILMPDVVAARVYQAVIKGTEGRIVIS